MNEKRVDVVVVVTERGGSIPDAKLLSQRLSTTTVEGARILGWTYQVYIRGFLRLTFDTLKFPIRRHLFRTLH